MISIRLTFRFKFAELSFETRITQCHSIKNKLEREKSEIEKVRLKSKLTSYLSFLYVFFFYSINFLILLTLFLIKKLKQIKFSSVFRLA